MNLNQDCVIRVIRSTKIKAAARGHDCTLRIAGCCNYDKETTVLSHIRDFGGGGTGLKPDDTCAVFACSACHDALDRRSKFKMSKEDRYFYIARAMARTIEHLYSCGIITIKG